MLADRKYPLNLVVLFGFYVLAARSALSRVRQRERVAGLAATGIALAAFLTLGYRVWPRSSWVRSS